MSETQFIQFIAPVPSHNYFYYVQGSPNHIHSFSRAYIRFVDFSELTHFAGKFDDYIFLDAKGREYAAQVEFALFQRVTRHPTKTVGRRRDPLQGTIEHQPEYLDFLKRLKDCDLGENKVNPVVLLYAGKKDLDRTVSTPLVDFVIKKKQWDQKEGRKGKRSALQRRFRKEVEANDEDIKDAEESKSASSFFATNSGRKFKNKKRRQREFRSKCEPTDGMLLTSQSGDVGEVASTGVPCASIQTDYVRTSREFPPIGASSSKESSSRALGSDQS